MGVKKVFSFHFNETDVTPASLLNSVANMPYVPYVPKYILQTEILKISVLMKSNEGSFTDILKGAEF